MSNITPERIAELRRLLAARAHPRASQDQVYAVVNAAVASMPDFLDEIDRLRAALDASSGIYAMAQSAADAELKMRDEVEWLQAKAESAEKRLAALIAACDKMSSRSDWAGVDPELVEIGSNAWYEFSAAVAAAKGEA